MIKHWFTPHHSNNFRAKLLHTSGLFFVIGLLLVFNLFVRILDSTPYHILGFTSSVTIDEVVALTNQERIAAGLQPLKLSDTLSDAARRKAANMLEENYWAHNAPSGKSPWFWFEQAGYRYTHAGENLAKDFGSTDRMMAAWMNSPTHKENIVSPKYQEIGVAITPGTLLGQETVLVVQLFGSQGSGIIPTISQVTTANTQGATVAASPVPATTPAPTTVPSLNTPGLAIVPIAALAPTTPAPSMLARFNTFNLKKTAGLITTALLMLALVLDLIIAESSALSRRVGKNWAHLMFINVILILVTLAQAGTILPKGINVF